MGKSTRKIQSDQSAKPDKPYPEFPLTAHPNGTWCKKIRGRLFYFGPWNDPQAALDKYLKEKDDLHAGRVPRREEPEGATLRQLGNAFMKHKESQVDAGELSQRTFDDCYRTCRRLLDHFGKTRMVDDLRQYDFAGYRITLAKSLGPVALGNEIQRVRSLFKFAFDAELVASPLRFGPGFKRPSKKTLRLERAKKGPRLFAPQELQALLAVATPNLRAMILLACNGGLGNSDLASMPISAVDVKTGWVDYPRVKTGTQRRFPLWPETATAIREALARRPTPKNEADAGLLFITARGFRFCKAAPLPSAIDTAEATDGDDDDKQTYHSCNVNSVTTAFNWLFPAAGIDRKGRSFYVIRHVFETIAGESRDQIAVDHIMGHTRDDMASIYRERISDERLKAVTDHVHAWLFPKADKAEAKKGVAAVAPTDEE
jgi:integrase